MHVRGFAGRKGFVQFFGYSRKRGIFYICAKMYAKLLHVIFNLGEWRAEGGITVPARGEDLCKLQAPYADVWNCRSQVLFCKIKGQY